MSRRAAPVHDNLFLGTDGAVLVFNGTTRVASLPLGPRATASPPYTTKANAPLKLPILPVLSQTPSLLLAASHQSLSAFSTSPPHDLKWTVRLAGSGPHDILTMPDSDRFFVLECPDIGKPPSVVGRTLAAGALEWSSRLPPTSKTDASLKPTLFLAGDTLLAGSSSGISAYNIATGAVVWSIIPHASIPHSLPASFLLARAGLFHLSTNPPSESSKTPLDPTQPRVTLYTAMGASLVLMDLDTGRELASFTGPSNKHNKLNALAFTNSSSSPKVIHATPAVISAHDPASLNPIWTVILAGASSKSHPHSRSSPPPPPPTKLSFFKRVDQPVLSLLIWGPGRPRTTWSGTVYYRRTGKGTMGKITQRHLAIVDRLLLNYEPSESTPRHVTSLNPLPAHSVDPDDAERGHCVHIEGTPPQRFFFDSKNELNAFLSALTAKKPQKADKLALAVVARAGMVTAIDSSSGRVRWRLAVNAAPGHVSLKNSPSGLIWVIDQSQVSLVEPASGRIVSASFLPAGIIAAPPDDPSFLPAALVRHSREHD